MEMKLDKLLDKPHTAAYNELFGTTVYRDQDRTVQGQTTKIYRIVTRKIKIGPLTRSVFESRIQSRGNKGGWKPINYSDSSES